jgi:hypothetical protein
VRGRALLLFGEIEFLVREVSLLVEIPRALEFGLRELIGRACPLEQRHRLIASRLRGLHARLRLRECAWIEQLGVGGLDGGEQGLSRLDGVAGMQLDPQQTPAERRGDDVAFLDPRAAVLVHGDVQRTAPDGCHIHRGRSRRERIDQPRRHVIAPVVGQRRIVKGGQIVIAKMNLSARRHIEPAEDIEQRRFSTPRRPEQHHELAQKQIEIHPAQRLNLHLAHLIFLRDPACLEDRLATRHLGGVHASRLRISRSRSKSFRSSGGDDDEVRSEFLAVSGMFEDLLNVDFNLPEKACAGEQQFHQPCGDVHCNRMQPSRAMRRDPEHQERNQADRDNAEEQHDVFG